MKNVLFEKKKINLWSKQHFVETEVEIVQGAFTRYQILLLPTYVKFRQLCANNFIFMGSTPRGDADFMIFFHSYLNLAKDACLGISFQSDATMPTAFVLQVYKCSKFWGLNNHLSMNKKWCFPFLYHATCWQHWRPYYVLTQCDVPRYTSTNCRHRCFLPHDFFFHSLYIQRVTGGKDQTSGGCSLC